MMVLSPPRPFHDVVNGEATEVQILAIHSGWWSTGQMSLEVHREDGLHKLRRPRGDSQRVRSQPGTRIALQIDD